MKLAASCILSGVLLANTAFAGDGSGRIQEIMVHDSSNGGVVFFRVEGNSNKASCSTAGAGKEWAVSLSREFGRAILSQLLAAQSQEKNIYVKGAGDCNDWSDRERPLFVYLNGS